MEDEGFNPNRAIAVTFEDSLLIMKKSNKVYVSVMINLSILSLNKNFIPNLSNRETRKSIKTWKLKWRGTISLREQCGKEIA